MTPRRKLIEVALPLEAINRESAREKSIRHGHPSTLHLWWSRKPLATCRAVLFASLVDDPSSRPDEFPTDEAQEAERQRLFRIIEALVRWEATTDEAVLDAARDEIRRSCGGAPPPVFDPFCGGGSIPLEAQRLGLEAHGSDLNPVAVLITKALIEIPPRFDARPPVHPEEGHSHAGSWRGAQGLAEDVRHYGRWMRDEAWQRIGNLYPTVTLPPERGGGEATVIAWLWARTVTCPNPACGIRMPLVSKWSLSAKKGKERFVEPMPDRAAGIVRFAVREGTGAPEGTVNRRGARCVACDEPVPLDHVRAEGKAGRMGAQLMAIVAEGHRERVYLAPSEEHEAIAASAEPHWAPDSELPEQALGFRVQGYGMTHHRDLFTKRQLAALATFADLVCEARERVVADALAAGLPDDGVRLADGGAGAIAYADAVATYLGLGVGRLSDIANALCRWENTKTQVRNLFTRQAISMMWDFAETNLFGGAAGDFAVSLGSLARAVDRLDSRRRGSAKQLDATAAVNGVASPVFATDPPYYDNIAYADLSDFFYVWLRRSLGGVWPQLFSTLLTPKSQELVADPNRFDGGRRAAEEFFERGLGEAFARMHETHNPDYPLTVFYAFKQAEDDRAANGVASTGWETMLEGLIASGFSVTGTWPMRSELGNRMRSLDSNALASSIVLVCRPRSADAPLATRRELLAALKAELPKALRELQHGNIAPVDLAQASIGPGMAVFSRYAKVVEADGSPMGVRAALGLINRSLDEILAEQEGDFDADTRWAVAWFDQYGMNEGPFGVAETLFKAKNTSLDTLRRAGILKNGGGKVRLLERDELPAAWDPATDKHLTVWEVTQYLIRAHESGGEAAAAELLRRVGGLGGVARELAYRLYVICERKKWAKDALAYNALVVAWPEIARLTANSPGDETQGTMF